MPYYLHIPEPEVSNKRAIPIPLNKILNCSAEVSKNGNGLKGMFTSSNAWIGSEIVDTKGAIYWRGDMARSWLVFYLRHYDKVSDVFLMRDVGISDLTTTVSSLMGNKYQLPIVAIKGTTTIKGKSVNCVWYSIDERQLIGGKGWNQAA